MTVSVVLLEQILKIPGICSSAKRFRFLNLVLFQPYRFDKSCNCFFFKLYSPCIAISFIIISFTFSFLTLTVLLKAHALGVSEISLESKLIHAVWVFLYLEFAYVVHFHYKNSEEFIKFLNATNQLTLRARANDKKNGKMRITGNLGNADWNQERFIEVLCAPIRFSFICFPYFFTAIGIIFPKSGFNPFGVIDDWLGVPGYTMIFQCLTNVQTSLDYITFAEVFLVVVYRCCQFLILWNYFLVFIHVAQVTAIGNLYFAYAFLDDHLRQMTSQASTAGGIRETCLYYRRIQLLATFLNKLQSGQILSPMVFVACSVQIASFGILVRFIFISTNQLSGTMCMFFLFTGMDCLFVTTIAMGGAAKVYHTSERIVEKVRLSWTCTKIITTRDEKYRRMQIATWRKIKIEFFSSNFFENITPLVLEQFCISCIANTLILMKK